MKTVCILRNNTNSSTCSCSIHPSNKHCINISMNIASAWTRMEWVEHTHKQLSWLKQSTVCYVKHMSSPLTFSFLKHFRFLNTLDLIAIGYSALIKRMSFVFLLNVHSVLFSSNQIHLPFNCCYFTTNKNISNCTKKNCIKNKSIITKIK